MDERIQAAKAILAYIDQPYVQEDPLYPGQIKAAPANMRVFRPEYLQAWALLSIAHSLVSIAESLENQNY